MGILFRYELKKLLNRKLVWALVALFTAYLVYANWNTLARGTNGYVEGMRSVYAQYEGRVFTDALKGEVIKAYSEYVAMHPSQYKEYAILNDTSVYTSDNGYYAGVSDAYVNIFSDETLEDFQGYYQDRVKRLKSIQESSGNLLTDSEKKYLEKSIREGITTPVVRYCAGWEEQYNTESQVPGWFLLSVLVYTLYPLFNKEYSSKMEGVMLCAGRRRQAAFAKMLAASCIAVGNAVLYFGIGTLFTLIAYGLDGAALPCSLTCLPVGNASMPIGALFALSYLATLLAAAACAALVACSSAASRNPLLSLLYAFALIVPQIVLGEMFRGGGEWMGDSQVAAFIQTYCTALPAELLLVQPVRQFINLDFAITAIALPAAVIALCFGLAPRLFLRRRKA